MIRKPMIGMKLHVPHNMANWEFGANFVDMLCDLGPQFTPERLGIMERRTKPFESTGDCKAYWGGVDHMMPADGGAFDFYDDFVWTRRKKVKTAGIVQHTQYRPRFMDTIPASIRVEFGFEIIEDWKYIFSRFCSLCKPMYAMLHPFDGVELSFGSEDMRRDHFISGGYHWHLAKNQFPNLAWINVFDGKFRDIADRSALEKDGFHTETIGDGWLLQLTPMIADVQADYAQFIAVRAKAKRHFPGKFFLLPD